MTMRRCSSSCMMRSVSMRFRRAFPCTRVVCIATWKAFRDTAGISIVSKAMAISATDTCSPVVSSISSSRLGGSGLISFAFAISSSVVFPIAERTTITSLPFLKSSAHLLATLKMRSLFPTEVPPNFFTISIDLFSSFFLSHDFRGQPGQAIMPARLRRRAQKPLRLREIQLFSNSRSMSSQPRATLRPLSRAAFSL